MGAVVASGVEDALEPLGPIKIRHIPLTPRMISEALEKIGHWHREATLHVVGGGVSSVDQAAFAADRRVFHSARMSAASATSPRCSDTMASAAFSRLSSVPRTRSRATITR